jgi:hypothetical protein
MKSYLDNYTQKLLCVVGITICLFQSCSSSKHILQTAKTYDNFRGFEPTDPTEYNEKVPIVINDQIVYKEIRLLTTEQMLSFLNNETVLVQYSGKNLCSDSAKVEAVVINAFYFSATHVYT